MRLRYILAILLFLFGSLVTDESSARPQDTAYMYPKGYFRNPLNIPILLAGNFGECRPNHFHSGIDIKTGGKENLPVFSVAEGYVSRIKMEKGGFGHALYVTHPNGFTTLYAHLNDFSPKLQHYLRSVQYQKESWAVDIPLKPEQFPVKKGEQIAWSGNTGASTAPHLHFEIRDSETEHPLNPLLFGFPIIDTRAPVPSQIAIYNLESGIYSQKPQFFALRRAGDNYTTAADTITIDPQLAGISIEVNDYMNGSDNTLNFYTARWYLDDAIQGSIRLDDIGYDVTRYLHAYADYRLYREKKDWFQCLFRLPGNLLHHLYSGLENNGGLKFSDDAPHHIKIVLEDASGNVTPIDFYVKSRLKTHASILCEQQFQVAKMNSFEHPNVKFTMPQTALYEQLCFSFQQIPQRGEYSSRYQLHTPSVPIHNYFDLFLKPEVPVPFALRDKIVMKYSDGKDDNGRAAASEDGWYKASVRNFGTYWLVTDTIPPVIRPGQKEGAVLSTARSLSITVSEDITSVKSFRAELDGKWLLFEPKGNSFFYTFDARCPKGRHELVITASDENNNSSRVVYHFTR